MLITWVILRPYRLIVFKVVAIALEHHFCFLGHGWKWLKITKKHFTNYFYSFASYILSWLHYKTKWAIFSSMVAIALQHLLFLGHGRKMAKNGQTFFLPKTIFEQKKIYKHFLAKFFLPKKKLEHFFSRTIFF